MVIVWTMKRFTFSPYGIAAKILTTWKYKYKINCFEYTGYGKSFFVRFFCLFSRQKHRPQTANRLSPAGTRGRSPKQSKPCHSRCLIEKQMPSQRGQKKFKKKYLQTPNYVSIFAAIKTIRI
jgi:hypothetical protein